MSDYSRAGSGGATHFTDKDAWTTGDSRKKIVGAQFDAEFNAILTACNSKHDSSNHASQAEAEGLTLDTVLITPHSLNDVLVDNGGILKDLQQLAAPGADVLLAYDFGTTSAKGFTLGAGLEFSGDTINLADAVAGDGLAISSSVMSVGGGAGITANADDVELTAVAAGATQAVSVVAGSIDVDISSLTQLSGAASVAGDSIMLIDNAADGTNLGIEYQNFGVPVVVDTTTTPLSGVDSTFANRMYSCSNASPIGAVIPANASVAFPISTILGFYQAGGGQVTITVTSDTLRAAGGDATSAQYAVMFATKVAATEWVVTGSTV